jgi:hypothetical protein
LTWEVATLVSSAAALLLAGLIMPRNRRATAMLALAALAATIIALFLVA